jgi:hypothetical protein
MSSRLAFGYIDLRAIPATASNESELNLSTRFLVFMV